MELRINNLHYSCYYYPVKTIRLLSHVKRSPKEQINSKSTIKFATNGQLFSYRRIVMNSVPKDSLIASIHSSCKGLKTSNVTKSLLK